MIFLRDLATNTHPYEHTHVHRTLPLLGPPKNQFELADLKIDEITTGASLSTGKSTTIKRIASLKPGINPEKYEHMSVGDLYRSRQVPPQVTQPAL
jgi:hypothetical protein